MLEACSAAYLVYKAKDSNKFPAQIAKAEIAKDPTSLQQADQTNWNEYNAPNTNVWSRISSSSSLSKATI